MVMKFLVEQRVCYDYRTRSSSFIFNSSTRTVQWFLWGGVDFEISSDMILLILVIFRVFVYDRFTLFHRNFLGNIQWLFWGERFLIFFQFFINCRYVLSVFFSGKSEDISKKSGKNSENFFLKKVPGNTLSVAKEMVSEGSRN